MRWFRFYSDVLDDPKVQRLPGELFKVWVNLLCLANEGEPRGTLPCVEDIAFRLRLSDEETQAHIDELVRRGLLDAGNEDDPLQPHNWEGRQRRSDDVAARVQKHRAKQDDADTCNEDETLHETETKHERNVLDKRRGDTETDTEADVRYRARPRLLEFGVTPDGFERSVDAFPDIPPDDWQAEAENFVSFHTVDRRQPPKNKNRAWTNWLLKSRQFRKERHDQITGREPPERPEPLYYRNSLDDLPIRKEVSDGF